MTHPDPSLHIVIIGASGMVGHGVLLECLASPAVESVLLVSRRPHPHKHPKIKEVLHKDFNDFSGLEEMFKDYHACFYTLGVSSLGLKESEYSRVTYDYTVAAARALVKANPRLQICFVSGAGSDSTEKGPLMWARVKGKAENALLAAGFSRVFIFRPGFIQPCKGVTSRTRLYNVLYSLTSWMFPLLEKLAPGQVTTTERIGRAMIRAAQGQVTYAVLGNREINEVGGEI